MSGGVCEPCHGNGSTEHRAAKCMQFFVVVILGDIATTTRGKICQPFEDDAMSRAQAFRWHKMFLKAEPLLKMSSAADDHHQHREVTTQHG